MFGVIWECMQSGDCAVMHSEDFQQEIKLK